MAHCAAVNVQTFPCGRRWQASAGESPPSPAGRRAPQFHVHGKSNCAVDAIMIELFRELIDENTSRPLTNYRRI
jgi:hypothetical protein